MPLGSLLCAIEKVLCLDMIRCLLQKHVDNFILSNMLKLLALREAEVVYTVCPAT